MSLKNLTQIRIFMQIQTEFSTQFLIDEITKVATQPYSEWAIGMGEKVDSERHVNVTVFSPNNYTATRLAYEHFVGLGMTTTQQVGTQMRYLYLFKMDGPLFPTHML